MISYLDFYRENIRWSNLPLGVSSDGEGVGKRVGFCKVLELLMRYLDSVFIGREILRIFKESM